MILTGDAEPIACTYGVTVTDPVTADVDAIAAGLHDAWGDELMPQLCNVISLNTTEIALQRTEPSYPVTPTSAPSVGFGTGAVVGGEVGNCAPQNCAYLLSKRSNYGGRRGQGRMYLPGVAEGDVSPVGIIGAGRLGTLATAAATWLARFGTGALTDVVPVILHSFKIEEGLPVPVPTTLPPPYPITAMGLSTSIATQRLRLRR